MKRWLVVLGCFGWGSSFSAQASVSQMMEGVENQENRGAYPAVTSTSSYGTPSKRTKPALDEISPLQLTISTAYQNADAKALREAYQAFIALNLKEEAWLERATALEAERWPAQTTAKERVGAHLFFPAHALEWFDCPYKESLFSRTDIFWGLYLSAQLNHSFGKYLFGRTLFKDQRLKDVSKNYFIQAIPELSHHLDNPEICYVLGRGQFDRENVLPSAVDLLSRHPTDPKHTYYAAKATKKLTVEEGLLFARAGFSPAYIEVVREIQDNNTKELFLKEAAEKGYVPALLHLGYFYKHRGVLAGQAGDSKTQEENNRLAIVNFTKAAEHGFAAGYIELGKFLVGDPTKTTISHFSPEAKQQAADYFHQAGEKTKDPRGWECLIAFWEQELRVAEEQQDANVIPIYKENLIGAIEGGLKLGLDQAFLKAPTYSEEEKFKTLVQNYGFPRLIKD